VAWTDHARSLHDAIARHPHSSARARLDLSLKALASGDFQDAVGHARAALEIDSRCSVAWRLIALAFEGQGDGAAALDAYRSAYAIEPGSHDILADLGRLASALGLSQVAVEFFSRALALNPGSAHLIQQLSGALRDGHEYGLAIGAIRDAIRLDPQNAALWNALAAVLLQQGDTENALTMADEALTHAPDWSEALYNRAIAKLELGDLPGAEADCDAAAATAEASEKAAIRFVRAQVKLAAGDLQPGWSDYRARLDPTFPKSPRYATPGRPWKPNDRLEGAKLLVIGEQGLGDEIMFAGMIPDVLAALGPKGRLTLAVAPRLTSLFQRTFPAARVVAHRTVAAEGRSVVDAPDAGATDLWAPMGSLTRRFRLKVEDFDKRPPYLIPSPEAVAHWRGLLDALGDRPKVGLAWKSMKTYGHRLKQYAAFADWTGVLKTPDVAFVNIQYGDCLEELAAARALGVEIWTPPGLDLTDDIDGSASLSAALDLVIGVGNASTNLAAAVGCPTWFVCAPTAWPTLGTGRHPWFPNTRAFPAARFGDWGPTMQTVAEALGREFQTA
jgi:tetratricopeptide (TPR) repeat protein